MATFTPVFPTEQNLTVLFGGEDASQIPSHFVLVDVDRRKFDVVDTVLPKAAVPPQGSPPRSHPGRNDSLDQ
jgi:hypothetical protein